MNKLTDTQAAYLAGLIDGEGCLTILKQNSTNTKEHRTPIYTANIIVRMTEQESIRAVMGWTGAGFITGTEKRKENSNAVYSWSVTKIADIREIIYAILPYLCIKKDQAITLLDFIDQPKARQTGPRALSPVYVMQRERFYQRMRDLKTRGRGLLLDEEYQRPEPEPDPQLTFELSC